MGADVIANILPFERTSLARAADRFFQRLSEAEMLPFAGQHPAQIVVLSATLTSMVTALEFARRRCRQKWLVAAGVQVRDPRSSRNHAGFPELPGSWSSRLL
jgi:hypothetical protein